jgi:predicted Zn-dependent protease
MKFNFKLVILFILYSSICLSQNMKEGFTYLETGKYKKAEIFFKNILVEYPTNKTAKLCFGRAIGLNGNSKESVEIFTDLLKIYPEDFEIKLNYAESLLWNKNYTKAKGYYQNLVKESPKSFPAILGYANTLSNLKIYDQALEFVNKALLISPGNLNALTSKKYIYLGYANQYVQKREYTTSIKLLNENLLLFENDTETLLNLANVYLISNDFSKAKAIYITIGESSENKLASLNGLALVSHLNGKEKEALKISSKAMNSINSKTSKRLTQQTKERYTQALIWNRKYKEANGLIQKINKEFPNENWALLLRATLNIYKSNFKESLADYNRVIKNDSTSFDGNLGKANALKASKLYNEAYKAGNKALVHHNNQKDIVGFLKNLNTDFTPFVETKSIYSIDNGNNQAISFYTGIEFPFSTRLKLNANFTSRNTKNTLSNIEATAKSFSGGLTYQLYPKFSFKGNIGVTTTKDFSQLSADIKLLIKPSNLQDLTIGYNREIQNFNADLLNREIVQNNFYANYSLNTNFNLGWYTQYYYTTQNDNNIRNLLFTSLYYNILNKPLLKGGINYQHITFKDQVPTVYFSPEKFNAVEVFIDLFKDKGLENWFYLLNAATGYQFIEDDDRQNIYRVQGKLGYKVSDRCITNLYINHSNIASAIASGFKYTEIGFELKWYFTKKPIFRKK